MPHNAPPLVAVGRAQHAQHGDAPRSPATLQPQDFSAPADITLRIDGPLDRLRTDVTTNNPTVDSREAIAMLEQDGFVKTVPRRGIVVVRRTKTEIVLLITPRIVRTHDLRAQDLSPIYIGTQSNMALSGPPATIGGDVPPPPPTMCALRLTRVCCLNLSGPKLCLTYSTCSTRWVLLYLVLTALPILPPAPEPIPVTWVLPTA